MLDPAALVVGGESLLGRAIVARLAAVARVVLGEIDPTGLGPALDEIARVGSLYGRTAAPALSVGRDVAALLRSAHRLLPPHHGVVVVEPTPAFDVDGFVGATGPETRIVLVSRAPTAAPPRCEPRADGRTLWSLRVAAAPGGDPWTVRRTHSTAEAEAARTVRDLLFPHPSAPVRQST